MKKLILMSLLLTLASPLQGVALNSIYFGLDNMRGFAPVYWWFLADGRILRGLPTTGLAPEDFENACKGGSPNCGTYSLSGDKLTIKYRNGQPENWTFKTLNGGIQMNYIILTPVQKYPAGTHLNGNWNRPFTARVGSATITSPTFLSFKSDGTFSEKNITGLETRSTVPGASVNTSSSGQSAGTYTIKDNVLMLVRTGKSERHMIFPLAGDNLNIDGSVYSKAK